MKLFWMLSAVVALYWSGSFVTYSTVNEFWKPSKKGMKVMYVVGLAIGLVGTFCCHMLL